MVMVLLLFFVGDYVVDDVGVVVVVVVAGIVVIGVGVVVGVCALCC